MNKDFLFLSAILVVAGGLIYASWDLQPIMLERRIAKLERDNARLRHAVYLMRGPALLNPGAGPSDMSESDWLDWLYMSGNRFETRIVEGDLK